MKRFWLIKILIEIEIIDYRAEKNLNFRVYRELISFFARLSKSKLYRALSVFIPRHAYRFTILLPQRFQRKGRCYKVHGFFKSLSSIFISSVNLFRYNGTRNFWSKLTSNRLNKRYSMIIRSERDHHFLLIWSPMWNRFFFISIMKKKWADFGFS